MESRDSTWTLDIHVLQAAARPHSPPALPPEPSPPTPSSPGPPGLAPPSPHGVQQGAVLLDPQQLVGHGHVVRHGLLAVVEEGVGGPDLAGHQVVETQDVHRPVEPQPLVLPALPEEHVYGVLL